MPLNTFVPPMRPSPGTTWTPEIALRKSSFGDGYTQASPAGLNSIRRTVNLQWEYLTIAEAKAINDFFTAQGGYIPFYYRLNGETVDRKWTCESWTVTDGHPSKATATLKENFTTVT